MTVTSRQNLDGLADETASPALDQEQDVETAKQSAEKEITSTQNVDGPADQIGWADEEIAAAQQQDAQINPIIALMSISKDKPAWKDVELQSAEVKSLWNEWERLEVRGGIVCRKWTSISGTSHRWQIVLPRNYRKEFIHMVHTGMTGGHLGRSKTEEQVRQRAYWPNWRSDVTSELKRCVECEQYPRGKAPRQTPLHPFNAGEPFEVVAVDITGRHPKSVRGHEYIVTITDIFSKWSEAYAVRTHTAIVIAKLLIDNFFSRFGMPKRILTDQGAEFESQLFQELCTHMGIEKMRTTPYKPSTNFTIINCEMFSLVHR